MQFEQKIKEQKDIDTIIYYYLMGMSIPKICKTFGYTATPVMYILKKNNITIKPTGFYKKYTHDNKFFSKIDSHDKAQILGLLAADGNVYKNTAQIFLQIKDFNYLNDVKNKVKYSGELRINKNTPPNKDSCGFYLHDSKTINDLKNLGIIPNKSLILKFPTPQQVPDEFINSYILGYLEGDGCICLRKNVNKCQVSIIGNIEYIDSLKKFLIDKLNIKICQSYKKTKNTTVSQIHIGAYDDIITFCNWIYKDCSFKMKRKYENYIKFKEMYKSKLKYNPNNWKLGEDISWTKLKAFEVMDIKNQLKNGVSGAELGRKYKVSKTTIYDIKSGKSWSQLNSENVDTYGKGYDLLKIS